MNEASYTVTPWVMFLYVASVFAFSFSAEDVHLSTMLGLCMVLVFGLESFAKKLFFFGIFTWSHFFFFLFVMLCAGSLVFEPEGYLRVRTLALLFVLSIVLSNVVGRTGDLRPVILGVLTGLGYAIIVGLEQALSMSSVRFASTLSNANTYAVALLLGTLLCLYNLFLPQVKRFRRTYFLCNLVFIAVFGYQIIFLSGSRNGIFVFVMILLGAYIFFSWRLTGFARKTSVVGGIALAIALAFVVQLSPHYSRVQNALVFSTGTTVREGSINTRAAMLQEAFDLWMVKPLLGWGADQFRYVSTFGRYSHSNFSELLVNFGIIGFLIFYSIYVYIFYKGIILFRAQQMETKRLGFWILVASGAFLVMGVASVSYYSKIHWILFASIFGLIAAEDNARQKSMR
jgi:O-antigen ligase